MWVAFKIERSMNAPDPLIRIADYIFLAPLALRAAFHLNQVGNPAPPRPANPEILFLR